MKTGVLFAGQGAQFPEMGQDLYRQEPLYRDTVDQAAAVLNLDLTAPEVWADPANTQLAIYTMSVGIWRLLVAQHVQPAFMLGLSLGEYSALTAAGSLSFPAGLQVIRDRAHYMATAGAAHPGKMAAVLTNDVALVEQVISPIDEVTIANYNTPRQMVLGGTETAVNRALTALKSAGIKRTIPLKLTVASHTPLMQSAASALQTRLAAEPFQTPRVPVWSNTLAAPFTTATIAETLATQLVKPTRFAACLTQAVADPVDCLIEIGPGHALSGFAKQLAPAIPRLAIADGTSLAAWRDQPAARK